MAAEDSVMVAAHAREEVRKSLDRMAYHLTRGPRGVRGWEREVRFLDSLSKQSARLGQNTALGTAIAGGKEGLGSRALAALEGGNSASIGRTKSSLLASFSDDTMLGARAWTYEGGFTNVDATWIWMANASACAACLANHGEKFYGAMVPEHPSCLCWPTDDNDALARGVKKLDDGQLLDTMRNSNNPRWRAQAQLVDDGRFSVRDVINLNKRPSTFKYYKQTLKQLQMNPVNLEETEATYQRLEARMKARGWAISDDFDFTSQEVRIEEMARMLGCEHGYMLVLYPEDFDAIMANDYSAYGMVIDHP